MAAASAELVRECIRQLEAAAAERARMHAQIAELSARLLLEREQASDAADAILQATSAVRAV